MVKTAMIGIMVIVVISVIATIGLESSVTGDASGYAGYGYSSRLYGPGLKNAVSKTPAAFGKAFAQQAHLAKNQAFMLEHKDKWVCGKTTPEGVDPCMLDETDLTGKTWCCLPYQSTQSLASPKSSKSLTMVGGIVPKN